MKMKSVIAVAFLALIFGALSVSRAQDGGDQKRTLSVNGRGEASAEADVAYLRLSVETMAKSASQAVKENAEKTNKVMETIKARLGEDDKVSTAGYSLSPVYEYNNQANKSEFKGYMAGNQIVVEAHNLKEIGKIIDSTTEAGLNKIESLSFDTTKRANYRREALRAAVEDARATAETVAKAAGVSITKIVQLSPSYDYPTPVYRDYALSKTAVEESAPTPIEPGDITVSASVNMVFEIE
ncbi:MAG: SIMPL domain-containing protein [Deltaproteobacteria bacterium]